VVRRRIAILGGGPGGYEAALVAAQLGADVTVVDSDGLGGACVLTDCVPSKTLIETSNAMTMLNRAPGSASPPAGWPPSTPPASTSGSPIWPGPSPATSPPGSQPRTSR
jgi:dihydrolipoamide dehydrogenase